MWHKSDGVCAAFSAQYFRDGSCFFVIFSILGSSLPSSFWPSYSLFFFAENALNLVRFKIAQALVFFEEVFICDIFRIRGKT